MTFSYQEEVFDSPSRRPWNEVVPPKPCFYVLRHAESEYNIGNHDVFDAPLSGNGKIQASHLYGHFDIILCSPMTRALQTLQCSNIIGDKLVLCHELREFKMAKADFLPFEEVVKETWLELEERFSVVLDAVVKLVSLGYKVLAIGHHQWFKRFTNGELVLKNAEMATIEMNVHELEEPAVKIRKIGK